MTVLEDFIGTVCSTCGCGKRSTHSFCYPCFRRLPRPLAQALYRRFGDGYEAAFAAAQQYLRGPAL